MRIDAAWPEAPLLQAAQAHNSRPARSAHPVEINLSHLGSEVAEMNVNGGKLLGHKRFPTGHGGIDLVHQRENLRHPPIQVKPFAGLPERRRHDAVAAGRADGACAPSDCSGAGMVGWAWTNSAWSVVIRPPQQESTRDSQGLRLVA